MSTQKGYSLATSLIKTESRNTVNSKKKMKVMASGSPSPHLLFLSLGLAAHQPSKRHHVQSLLGPSFHDSRTTDVLESHPERAAPLFHHDNERRHDVSCHSALALHLYLVACNTSSSCRF